MGSGKKWSKVRETLKELTVDPVVIGRVQHIIIGSLRCIAWWWNRRRACKPVLDSQKREMETVKQIICSSQHYFYKL